MQNPIPALPYWSPMAAMLHPFFPHLAEEHGLFFGPTGDEVRQGALQSLGFPQLPLELWVMVIQDGGVKHGVSPR